MNVIAADNAHPLDLTERAAPLLVAAGTVNVFAVPPGGRRRFLFAVPAGALLCGLPALHGHRIVAVGTLGTRLRALAWSDVTPALLAGWCAALDCPPVATAAALPPLHARAAARLTEQLDAQAHARMDALSAGWRRAAERTGRMLAGFAALIRQPGRAPAAEPAGNEDVAAALVPEQEAATRPSCEDVPPHASAACAAVHRIAAALATPVGALRDDGAGAAELLARAGIRHRAVLLRGAWWRRDNGPLIGFDEHRQPCALLPVPRGYRLVRADGVPAVVDAHTVLAPEALMPYRPLPRGTVNWRGLLRFAGRGGGADALRLLGLAMAAAVPALLVPAATGLLAGSVLPRGAWPEHWQLAALLLAAALGAAGFELCKALLVLRGEARIDLALQAALFDRLLRLPMAFFRRHTVGDLADRALGVQEMRTTLSATAGGVLSGAVFAIASLAAMLYYSVPLALAGLGLVAAFTAFTVPSARRQLRHEAEHARHRGMVDSLVLQFVAGIGKLRVAAAEERALAAWGRHYAAQTGRFAAVRTAALVPALVRSCMPALAALAVCGAIAYGPGVPRDGSFAFGDGTGALLAFGAAFGQLLGAATALTAAAARALHVVPLYRRLLPLLRADVEGGQGSAPGELRGAIALTDVTFRYDDGPAILAGVSLAVAPGEFVAIVGPSGSGKSTLLRLMMGLDAPAAGTIAFDGQPLAELDVAALRRRIGVVLQHGRVAAGTVYDNIAGGERIGHEEAMHAARQVGLAADIDALPMGLHTVLHDGGGALSGGQRQRLLLAHALARKPALLLLDEATSALDNRTQAVLMDSLARLALTRVVVAHRLSTVKHADRIYVMEGGRIVQQGRYEELLARPGLFAELAQRQLL